MTFLDLVLVFVGSALAVLVGAALAGRVRGGAFAGRGIERPWAHQVRAATVAGARVREAEAAGTPPPAKSVPLPLSYAMAALGSAKARLRGTDERLSLGSLRLMRAEAPVDCAKARRELGWEPRPVEESIREAARFWVGLRDAKRRSRQGG